MIRIYTLGSIELQSDSAEQCPSVVAQPKRLALLAYLAMARPFGFHRRDRVFAMFWPEQDDAHARDSLNQAIRFLRQALGSRVIVSRGAEEVGLDRAQFWCDALEFRAAVDDGRLPEAMELYRGELLGGFFVSESLGFDEWLEGERTRLREQASQGARTLAEREESAGNVTHALRWGRLAAGLSNGDERALRRWLGMLARGGDRAGAIQAYEEFARRFKETYDAAPSPETQALIEQIRRDSARRAPAIRVADPVSPRLVAGHSTDGPLPPPGISARGWYQTMFEIGAGGMATVYLARDLKHERWVAVKVLRPDVALAVGVKGFLREIRIAAGLQHPNIVPVFDSGERDGRVYYVMPQVQGESLRARLQRERMLPLDEARRLACEVADALAYAHSQGIVHCDIKPENILLSSHEGSPVCHAMVTDFGIARAVAQSGAEDRLTQTGVVVGTPTYMSPEQASGGEALDGRCDVYSLGCVLYEMIAGTPPFAGATRFAVLAKHADAPIPSLRASRPGVSARLDAAVQRALAKQPADRFADAAAFARAIREAAGSSIVAPDGSEIPAPNESASRRVRWRRTPVTGGTLVAAALAVGMWLGSMSDRSTASPDNSRSGAGREPIDAFLGGFPAADIAALYFEDLSPEHRLQYLADGLTEALISDLARVPRLHVASRNAVAASRGRTSLRTDSLGLTLRVGTLVRGSVTSGGSGVRVTIELVDPLSGRKVASTQIEQSDANGIALQDSLARAATQLLRQRLEATVPRIVSEAGTHAPLAWDAKQRARSAALEADRCLSAGDTAAALRMLSVADSTLTIAEARDPNWTEPIVERARLASQRARLVPASTRQLDEEFVVGLSHANRALRTAPNDAGALEMRGTLNYLRWLYHAAPADSAAHVLQLAEQDLVAATAGETQQATAWYTLSHLRLNTDNNAGAATAAENALRLDPFLPRADFTVQRLFLLALDRGDRDDARKWCDAGYRRFPESYRFLECQLWLFALPAPDKPNMAEAWRHYDTYVAATPANLREYRLRKGRLIVALAFVQAGRRDSAEALAAANQGDSLIDPARELTTLAAIVYARAGAREKALALIGKALARAPSLVEWNDQSWWFSDLRSDPRYKALLRRPR